MTNLQSPYPSLRSIPEKERHSVSQLKLRFVPGSDNRPQSVQEKKIQTETLPERQQWLADIEELPARLRAAVAGLRKHNSIHLTGPAAGPSAKWCITSRTVT
jgi:hypothetical protein